MNITLRMFEYLEVLKTYLACWASGCYWKHMLYCNDICRSSVVYKWTHNINSYQHLYAVNTIILIKSGNIILCIYIYIYIYIYISKVYLYPLYVETDKILFIAKAFSFLQPWCWHISSFPLSGRSHKTWEINLRIDFLLRTIARMVL